jgi:signal peptidase I
MEIAKENGESRSIVWATGYIEKLANGETVEFRPRGSSMKPLVNSGDLVVVEPITDETELEKGDIVLCKVNGKQFLHLISAIQGERFQISNNRGYVNGWVSRKAIFGVLIENKRKEVEHDKEIARTQAKQKK